MKKAWLLLVLFFPASIMAQCPSNTSAHFAKNTTIYYSINANIASNATENSQILAGIDTWNSANATNGSGIQFAPAAGVIPPTWSFTNGTTPVGVVAQTQFNTSNGLTTSATTTIGIKHPN
ncbi:MAG TPA: hypothetical protein VGM18_05585 [Candidatus Sulfotelmatobacter sp.]|jgi:hypothetical protein